MKIRGGIHLFASILLLSFLWSCSGNRDTRFEKLDSGDTGIDFANEVVQTPEFNIQQYLYFYDGAGVSAGDINNDGYPDLFFAGNSVPDRLYLNKGNFQFEDITESAGILHDPDSWATGVSMADVNGDGYLDIYVSRVNYLDKSGSNLLYINNGDSTFSERADEYGLDFEGYSTQGAFFDYNNDGLLDLFLLNHSFHSEDTYGDARELRQKPHPRAGDRLFRNDGDSFTDVTRESGIYTSALGYGLGLAVMDINHDGYMDIYVGNDFHENDYFYINNGDGSFRDELYSMVSHTSSASMGNDAADINNDGWTDIVSLDMMSQDYETRMVSGGPDLVVVAEAKRGFGFGNNNNRNTLQINRGESPDGLPVFSEVAFASGIARTDWSWSALIADYDNSGYKDLYITNGIPKMPNNLDYVAALQQTRQRYTGDELENRIYDLHDRMPDNHTSNVMFLNNGDLTFTDVTSEWGLKEPLYSNGAVYADFNNDGFLDIAINNLNEEAVIYRNAGASKDTLSSNYLTVSLRGDGPNTTGIGSKVFLYADDEMMYRELSPVRGFQSSSEHRLHFGLGETESIDSLLVIWPDRRFQVMENLQANRQLELSQGDASGVFDYSELKKKPENPVFSDITDQIQLDYRHNENAFSGFSREPLMPYELSSRGPAMAVGDVNNDGLDDLYFGGSRGFSGKLLIQQPDGSFVESSSSAFNADRLSEDVDALFFDATGDGMLDLYVVSGGNEFTGESAQLLDRFYVNVGNGEFRKSMNSIPDFAVNGSVVRSADVDGDGDLDLFVGGHSIPWQYGIGPRSFIFENNGNGVFRDMTPDFAPELETIGNVTSAEWMENEDGHPDLVVAGEWMSVKYFENLSDSLVERSTQLGLADLKGWWQSVHISDLNGDGREDIVVGNFGINSRLSASTDSPVRLYVNDFDGDGQTSPIISVEEDIGEVPFEQLDEILAQIPSFRERITSYSDFANRSLAELFEPARLDSALQKEITELRSMILMSREDGGFDPVELPFEAQLFPVMAIESGDFDSDGLTDILLGGNLHSVKPSYGGRLDAGFGLYLKGLGNGNFAPIHFNESGLFAPGELRTINFVRLAESEMRDHLLIARNDDTPLVFRLNRSD